VARVHVEGILCLPKHIFVVNQMFNVLSQLLIIKYQRWLGSRVVQIAVASLSGNSLRQTAHTHCASVHQAAKLVAALLRVAG